MLRFDHFVLNIESGYQRNQQTIEQIREAGFPYEPKWGKGTNGFKASNIWIGQQYLEMIHLLKADGGGWKPEWVEKYHQGHRGLICLMFDVDDLDLIYQTLIQEKIQMTEPEFLQFKWFFNLLTRTMPWRNSYLPFFEGIPMQLGFQEMKDEKSREFMTQYMVPNSQAKGILAINEVIIYGRLTDRDRSVIQKVFADVIVKKDSIVIQLNSTQTLTFQDGENYQVELMTTRVDNLDLKQAVMIENVRLL